VRIVAVVAAAVRQNQLNRDKLLVIENRSSVDT